MKTIRATSLLLTLALGVALPAAWAQTPEAAPARPHHEHPDASAATPKKDNGEFVKRHEEFLARAKSGPIGLLFLGDSITDNWKRAPAIWNQYYGKYNPANFGIGGDTTQNVIWRIENGELDGIHPRVLVLMLGTNNAGANNAAEIFAADRKIVGMIRQRLPDTKILLLAIFPRGSRRNRDGSQDNYVERMAIINAVNPQLATLDDGSSIRFLDIGAKFLGPDGKIPDAIMSDHLHPTVAGYQIWADAMQPLLTEMLQG
jgi:beta-glucosidase